MFLPPRPQILRKDVPFLVKFVSRDFTEWLNNMLNTILIMALVNAATFQNLNSLFFEENSFFYFWQSSTEVRTETLCLDDDIKEKQKKGAQEEEEGLMRRGNKGFLPTKFHVLMICVWLCDDYIDRHIHIFFFECHGSASSAPLLSLPWL